ncbi:glycosyltransferase [Acidocella aminolytica]|jgi:glycosyltransferase involved in cell wall biosynthesis|uniref:Glycosyl transferase n=1 Tax=Acidocella aminolytica 101 = DSM 11237 TaxID=1120923 RepID=A0A0D6PHZ3_9PROT|nr:glycosyltransferase [Acidocella aminolytica]GAN80449.1 glycosyl transferase [Acidocella aminolytica 101 = DSM 11237]GBQ35814.1 glycosyltransferase [Acidocella aminolytica 101 = DSM 11237]SHE96281.1 Glycosyltransferase involved in cell wall bisynthesis [Acidocella aminolytica 101 = DSM 11237]
MRQIGIFRHNLFKLSEPFIAQQAERLQRYRPLYLGRLRYGAAPNEAESLALEDLAPQMRLLPAVWHMLSASPHPYLYRLEGRRPDLLHAHFGVEGVYALPLAAQLGVPLVTTFHGFDATLSPLGLLANPAWIRYAMGRGRLAQQGGLFLAASSFLREKLLALNFPPERVRVHYIGVDTSAIAPRTPAQEEPLILHVARLEEVKGTDGLIRAFAQIAPQHPFARLVIIGDGKLRKKLHRLAAETGFADRIDFLGARPHVEVLGWMRRAAMLVLPSIKTHSGREEGLGMVMLEAAATGVPGIGARVGGIPEGIAEGETGFLVPERDADSLAIAMGTLLANPPLRHRMGMAARNRVEHLFDIRRQTAALEDIYDELLISREASGAAARQAAR